MTRGWLRARRRWVAIGAGAVALYALIGFFLVPRVARSQIVNLARTELHREARVARVRFNPFTLAGDVEGLSLQDRDGGPLFSVERMSANLQVSGLFHRAWRFRDLEIVGPSIEARILKDGKLNLADLFASTPGGEAKRQTSRLPRLIVDRFYLSHGRVGFVDESRSPNFVQALEPLDLEMHDLSTIPDETGEHAVTIGLGQDALVRWAGKQTLEPLHLEGRVEFTGISLQRLGEYAAPGYPLALSGGQADVGLAYDVRRAGDGSFAVAVKDASVKARDVAVGPRGRSESWVELPSAEASGITAAWPDSRVEVAAVHIADPKVLMRRDEAGTLSWTTVVPPARPSATPRADIATPWTAAIAKVEISGGEVTVDDRAVKPGVKTVVSELNVRLEALSTDLSAAVKAELSATIDGTARATASGTIVPGGPTGGLDIAVSDLDVTPFQPYAALLPGAQLHGGRAGVTGRLEVSRGQPWIKFDGTASIDALHVAGAGEDRLVAWDHAQATGVRATVAPNRVRVSELRVDGAFLKLRIDREGNVNLSKLRGPDRAAESPSAPAAPATPALPVEIGKIVLKDSTADFTDESLILPFGTKIHALNGDVRDISTTAAAPARIVLEGRVAEEGYVKADGTLRVADPFAATDIRVIFRNLNMPELTPYAAQFAGYSVQKGVLDIDVRYRFQDRHLVGDHHVVAKDLVLGPKVEGAKSPGLPVRLAIALLKDKDGGIDLEVPIDGTVDAPQFNYRSVFWQAIKAILSNAATAPFRAIGRSFGSDKEDLDLVGFAAGRSDLPAPERETLEKLAAELSSRAEISLEIEGRFDPVTDAAALRQARLESRIDAKRTPDASLDAILEAIYVETFSKEQLEAKRQDFIPSAQAPEPSGVPAKTGKKGTPSPHPPHETFDGPAFLESLRVQLLGAEPVAASDLLELAKSRAAAIAAVLTAPGGVDPSRVKIADPAPVKRKKQGSDLVASDMTMSAEDRGTPKRRYRRRDSVSSRAFKAIRTIRLGRLRGGRLGRRIENERRFFWT